MLSRRVRGSRTAGQVRGTDRIAGLAALNIAHELLRERRAPSAPGGDAVEFPAAGAAIDGEAVRRRIQSMQAAIEQALAGQEKLF